MDGCTWCFDMVVPNFSGWRKGGVKAVSWAHPVASKIVNECYAYLYRAKPSASRYVPGAFYFIALIARRLVQSPCLSFRRTRFTLINRWVTKVGPLLGNRCLKGRVGRRNVMMMMMFSYLLISLKSGPWSQTGWNISMERQGCCLLVRSVLWYDMSS